MSINTIREIAGHIGEKTARRNYAFDWASVNTREEKIEAALAVKV